MRWRLEWSVITFCYIFSTIFIFNWIKKDNMLSKDNFSSNWLIKYETSHLLWFILCTKQLDNELKNKTDYSELSDMFQNSSVFKGSSNYICSTLLLLNMVRFDLEEAWLGGVIFLYQNRNTCSTINCLSLAWSLTRSINIWYHDTNLKLNLWIRSSIEKRKWKKPIKWSFWCWK